MKNQRAEVEIEFVPWVCAECGNLCLMCDLERGNSLGSCPSCEEWNVFRAGTGQSVRVRLSARAAKAFEKGNS